MHIDNSSFSQATFSEADADPVSGKFALFGMWNLVLLLIVVFFAEVSSVQADGLFDFQMKLAKKGNAEAEFKVGEMYETGFGVKKDMKEAEAWIKKAAAQGHETAGFKLLYWDIQNNGMKGGNKAKYKELQKKAEAGNGQAMYYVGKMHANGVGMKKNDDKALDWLNKATFIGVLEAEREAILVREEKQRALANARKAEENRKAKAKLDEQRRKEEKAARLKQDKALKEQAAIQARVAEQEAAALREADEAARIAAQERAARTAADKEKKRQALLKQRKEDEAKKASFDSDPCSGKSARFLSTCR